MTRTFSRFVLSAAAILPLCLGACLQVPDRLYACAPDGGCPSGFGCGEEDLCIPDDVPWDAGVADGLVPTCASSVAQLRSEPGCAPPPLGCGADLAGTWCTAGGCLPTVIFPAVESLCRLNGVTPSWSGHTGTVKGGRAFATDGGVDLLSLRDERVDLSVDLALSLPCGTGDCLDTGVAMESAQPGLLASCTSSDGAGCQCVLRWSRNDRLATEVRVGPGRFTEQSSGETWMTCAGSTGLTLSAASASPDLVYTYQRP